jgi:peptide/nickel transport system substrate-binding protein
MSGSFPSVGRRLAAGGRRCGAALMLVASVGLVSPPDAAAETRTLRIGLAADPDNLDPTLARTFDSGLVLANACDRLFDITPDYAIVPHLASEYGWDDGGRTLTVRLRAGVRFQDGEPLDAAAVKYSIERHQNLPGSIYRTYLSPVVAVDAVDPLTVAFRLASPFAPLLSVLAGRAGMVVSPRAAESVGGNFKDRPVCAGPFRIVERVAQDRIVLERFEQYWQRERIHFDRIVYRAYPDTGVRLANLLSGSLDIIEQVATSDLPAIRANPRLVTASTPGTGYAGITINVGNGEGARSAIGRDPRIREALDLAIDRDVINDVVFGGEQIPASQWIAPQSPYHIKTLPVPRRDLDRARRLLREAGEPHPIVDLMILPVPERRQVAEVIQAMAKEAGFDIRLRTVELASALQASSKGAFEAFQLNFIGGPDPDYNIYQPLSCGASFNDGKYCNLELDRALERGRTVLDMALRQEAYAEAAAIVARDRPIIYLYHVGWHWAHVAALQGFRPHLLGYAPALDLQMR